MVQILHHRHRLYTISHSQVPSQRHLYSVISVVKVVVLRLEHH